MQKRPSTVSSPPQKLQTNGHQFIYILRPRRTQVENMHADPLLQLPGRNILNRKANPSRQQATSIFVPASNADIAAMRVQVDGSNGGQVIAAIAGKLKLATEAGASNRSPSMGNDPSARTEGAYASPSSADTYAYSAIAPLRFKRGTSSMRCAKESARAHD